MRKLVLLAATAFVVTGTVVGCDQTTSGTVAMTTEAGPATNSSTPSRPSRTSTPGTSTPRTSSNTPPPSGSMAVTCADYLKLDAEAQRGVIEDILTQQPSMLGPGEADIAKTLADGLCTFLPSAVVSQLLTGTPP